VEELRGTFGLVLVTSPAFSGANTTAYSVMNFLLQGQRDVLSLEAPIQWRMEGTRQVEVETGPTGSKMEETLRAVMAVRPDVLMLSALPDRGTAHLATQFASSLLVVATQTAQSAAQGLTGLYELGVQPHLLAGCLAVVTCQRLVRTICRICRVPADPPAPQTLANHGISAEEARSMQFFKGKGCPTCNTVGYRGRRAVFEVLPGIAEVRSAVQNGQSALEIETIARGAGMRSLRERCLALVREGTTTFDEFARLRL
jgi:type II secretory ATPase GspE/PulE/Tfp pilus assembly ATPase PilB-like protein